MAAVESPLPAVGDDDPVGDAVFECGDDGSAWVFVGSFLVIQMIGPVEPAVPRIDERSGQGRSWAVAQGIVRSNFTRGFAGLGAEAEQLKEGFEQLLADDLLSLLAPAGAGVAQQRLD